MDVEVVKCECCGLKEDCTLDYINGVKEKFNGKWLCGLCSEAVKYELSRPTSSYVKRLEDAIKAHMSFCSKNKLNPAFRVADVMRQILRRNSTSHKSFSSPSSSSSSPSSFSSFE